MGKRIKRVGNRPKFHVASVSWGAQSVCMLLDLLEPNSIRRLDMVCFVNLGKEFQAVYDMRDKILPILSKRNISYVEIDVSEQFEYLMFNHPVKDKHTGEIKRIGYSWCGFCRWGTCLKLQTLNQFYKRELGQYDIVEYVGIAADEEYRFGRCSEGCTTKVYPLVEDGISKARALQKCYEKGITWIENGIHCYDKFVNLSCFCCKNKRISELRAMYYYFPSYFNKLKEIQAKCPEPMKGEGQSVFQLETRFKREGIGIDLYDFIRIHNIH